MLEELAVVVAVALRRLDLRRAFEIEHPLRRASIGRADAPGPPMPARRSGSCTSKRRPRDRALFSNAFFTASYLEHSPYSQRDLHAPDEVPAPGRGRRLRHPRALLGSRPTAYHYTTSPFRRRRLGRLRMAVPFNIHGFQPITGRGPPAPAGPPNIPGTVRALFFVVTQVRLPPRAVNAPYTHSNVTRRSPLLRRRQLHDSTERGDHNVKPAVRRHPPRARARARSKPRWARRHDRGARGHDRGVPPPARHPDRVDLDDERYPYSWLPPEEASNEAQRAQR